MYGTVMIGKLNATREQVMQASEDWNHKYQVQGHRRTDTMFADDGETVVVAVQFASKEEYLQLADSPEQDHWWRTVMRPMLRDEPTWIDGNWDKSLTTS